MSYSRPFFLAGNDHHSPLSYLQESHYSLGALKITSSRQLLSTTLSAPPAEFTLAQCLLIQRCRLGGRQPIETGGGCTPARWYRLSICSDCVPSQSIVYTCIASHFLATWSQGFINKVGAESYGENYSAELPPWCRWLSPPTFKQKSGNRGFEPRRGLLCHLLFAARSVFLIVCSRFVARYDAVTEQRVTCSLWGDKMASHSACDTARVPWSLPGSSVGTASKLLTQHFLLLLLPWLIYVPRCRRMLSLELGGVRELGLR